MNVRLRRVVQSLALIGLLDACGGHERPLAGAAPQSEKEPWREQARTFRDVFEVGRAWWTWYLDDERALGEVGAWQPIADLTGLQYMSPEELEALLVPRYLDALPREDGWGQPYDFRLDWGAGRGPRLSVRSAGADGVFATDVYDVGVFPRSDVEQDIVWVDGWFARYPSDARWLLSQPR